MNNYLRVIIMEYFLNAIHYTIWLIYMKFGDFVGNIVEAMLAPIPKFLFAKEHKKKYYEHLSQRQKIANSFFHDQEGGFYIGWAHHLFGYFYLGYPTFFSFVLLGIADKKTESLNIILATVLFAIPIVVCYIPAYKAVFAKDRYLKYFKLFEKENEDWHRKWKLITVAFCVGSVAFTLLGICAMWGVRLL